MMGGPRRRGAPMPRMSIKGQGHILKRLMKIVFENYLWQFIAVIVCIVVTAYATIQSSTFTRDLVDVYIAGIQKGTKTMGDLANAMIPLGCVLALGVAASYIRQRLMVSVGQGTMFKIRTDLFTHMESLPIRYFDTHSHGDIMSIYTNDVDTLRQLISQSIPEVINSAISVVMVFFAMLNNSWIMTILSLILLTFQMLASAKLAKLSGKHFVAQQANLGRVNGFIEEMMTGQKVVKVFCHEEKVIEQFDELNEQLRTSAHEANRWANTLGPINNNLGHISYVICAMVGSALSIATGGTLMSTGRLVAFLTLNRNFSQPISQITQQLTRLLHVPSTDEEDVVAGDFHARFVHAQAAVRVAVEGKAHVAVVFDDELLQAPDVRRTRVAVDVQPVRFGVDDQRRRPQRVENRLGDVPAGTVGTVQRNPPPAEGVQPQRNQVADIAVAPGHIVHRAANLLLMREGNFVPRLPFCFPSYFTPSSRSLQCLR